MKQVEKTYRSLPFWSWNDKLDKDELVKQVEWMDSVGIGGFFMHARGGLKTEYLGDEWFECIEACTKRAGELGMEAYAYDENGWPSGFVGGKLLEDIENHDRYLTYSIGAYDKDSLVSYDMSKDKLIRVNCGENCLNVFWHYSTSTADILNPEVVDKFISETHEKYKLHDKDGLKGFFTDEPQYHRWATPYTKVLPPYFKEKYGEDILDGLGLLFVEKDGYRDFRYKFWKSMQELMLCNFGKRVYDWCDENGYKLTGHYIEENSLCGQMVCCGGIMPFYEYEHIPGIDYLGAWLGDVLSPKQVGSVASQLGKKQVMTETFAACGWNITPIELKTIAELQYVGGVNLMCQHLLPYKEHGQRKRDYPAHFSSVNPWVKEGFKDFNDYFSILGKMLSTSEEIVNVGVLHPLRSAYFDYKRFTEEKCHALSPLENSLSDLLHKLNSLCIGHHLIDETILKRHGHIEGSSLVVGLQKYSYLIIPKIYTMDKSTEKILCEYVKNGGKVLLTDEKPSYLEGKEYGYPYLISNTTWDEILSNQPYSIADNESIRTAYRRDENGKCFIYAVNIGNDTVAHFNIDCTSFESYDISTDTLSPVSKAIHFDKGQSYILYPSDKKPRIAPVLKPLCLNKAFSVKSPVNNYLCVDFARFSTDGEIYSDKLHHMGIFNELLQSRYKGKLYLKYEFEVEELPKNAILYTEYSEFNKITVNNCIIDKIEVSDFEVAQNKSNIASLLKNGKNEIVIELDYYQGENVYYALFGENVTESLKNCLAYDTEIEPVYIMGDFGVFGSFTKGKDDNILLGEDFKINAQPSEVSSLIEDGFPFFSGKITLSQKIVLDSTDYELVFDSNFHLVDVKVNGEYADRMMLSKRLDLSKHLKPGENIIELSVCIGNRNLLGPFHTLEQESGWTSPDSFERLGTWENGRSSFFRDSYAFVKSII